VLEFLALEEGKDYVDTVNDVSTFASRESACFFWDWLISCNGKIPTAERVALSFDPDVAGLPTGNLRSMHTYE
jgi:hypothetical protein